MTEPAGGARLSANRPPEEKRRRLNGHTRQTGTRAAATNESEPATERTDSRSESTQQFALTLDLENDWYFDEPGYDHLTFEYLDEFIELIGRLGVPLSIFVVGKTLEKYPDAIDRLATELDTEFHLHSYRHEPSENSFREELRLGKAAFRNHFGRDPVGYREPYGAIDSEQFPVLADEGFEFDSSVFPSYRPGVYNNLDTPLEPYFLENAPGLLEIPLGVFRGLRIPLSQNYLKLFGRPLQKLLSVDPLPETVVYNIHLQDLYRTDSHGKLDGIKRHIFERNLDNSGEILEESVGTILSHEYEAVTVSDIYTRHVEQRDR